MNPNPIDSRAPVYTVETHSPDETRALGRRLAEVLQAGQVVALQGELGAGKTVLTQGIAAGLGVTVPVTSPTFTLVNQYPTARRIELVHVDSYRLATRAPEATLEAATFGLEEILDTEATIVVIEWAERVAPLLPADHLLITLSYVDQDETARRITCVALGDTSAAALRRLQESDPLMRLDCV